MAETSSLEILWVHDEINGPQSGLAQEGEDKYWFERDILPSEGVNYFKLYRLSPEMLEQIQRNHESYCQETGAPLKHGDPYRFKRDTKMISKGKFENIVPEGEESVEVAVNKRVLTESKVFYHNFNSFEMGGEYVRSVSEGDFKNFTVPRQIIF